MKSKLSAENVLKVLLYVTLAFVTFLLIWNGPILAVIDDKTSMVESFVDLKDLPERFEWPGLTFCRTPIDKNETKYFEFMQKGQQGKFKDQAEFESLVEQTFYSKPEEIIHAITIGREYFEALNANKSDIPLAPPYVRSAVSDFAYNGYCAVISFEALREYMVSKRQIDVGELDSTFNAIIWLKGTHHVNGAFLTKFSNENDTLTNGLNTLLNTNAQMVEYKSVRVFTVSYGIQSRLKNCENKKYISPCILEYYERKHGNDTNNFVKKMYDITVAKFAGLEILRNLTGCNVPCENNEYFLTPFTTVHMDNFKDQAKEYLQNQGADNSSIVILSHMKSEKIKKIQEVPAYTAMTFLGDVGGIAGLFLGLSFWSIYESLIYPALLKFGRVISGKWNRRKSIGFL